MCLIYLLHYGVFYVQHISKWSFPLLIKLIIKKKEILSFLKKKNIIYLTPK